MITPFAFILLSLATWRLAFMLTEESGPFGLIDRLRYHAGAYPYACNEQRVSGQITNVLCCIYCASVWVAPLMLVCWFYLPVIVYIFALSGGALVIKRLIQ